MATISHFADFGSGSLIDTVAAAQNMAQQSSLGSLAGAGLGQGLVGYNMQQLQNQYASLSGTAAGVTYTNPQWYAYVNPADPLGGVHIAMKDGAAKVKAKAKRFIDQLRSEIDEWHGDILCRMAA